MRRAALGEVLKLLGSGEDGVAGFATGEGAKQGVRNRVHELVCGASRILATTSRERKT